MRQHPVCLRATLFVILVGFVTAVPLFSKPRTPATAVTITNNSGLEIRHVYLSPIDNDNWGPDQLNGDVIANGTSFTLDNLACTAASIKVIAEDQNGCFFYQTVTCGEASTWTITTSSPRDCGS
jgi:hypothetical protein